jgi:tRNA(Ile)-lysidine synthase
MKGACEYLDDDAFVAAAAPLTRGMERVCVGFSGGADSTALLFLFADNAERLGVAVEAVHFEHGIRGDASLADAEWCRCFCSVSYPTLSGKPPIPLRTISLGIPPDTPNIEAVARAARLEKWTGILRGNRAAAALGHHADDKMETLLLRLLRGGNASSLAAPRISRVVEGVRFISPLLGFGRMEIEGYLENRGIRDWRRDSTNDDTSLERNRVRHAALPALLGPVPERSRKGFLRSVSALERDADFIELAAGKSFKRLFNSTDGTLPAAETALLHSALRARVVRLWLSEVLDADTIPTAGFLERLDGALAKTAHENAGRAVRVPLSGDVEIEIDGDLLRLRCDLVESAPSSVEWNWRENPSLEWGAWRFHAETARGDDDEVGTLLKDATNGAAVFAVYGVPETLVVRARRPGDKMIPFGGERPVRVKKLLESAGTRGDAKRLAPVVAAPDGTILWLPHVRRSNSAPVDNARDAEVAVFTVL